MSTPTRNRGTNGTQSLVRTLLGDYTWADAGGPIPTGVFTRVLAEFGISDMAARLALERVAGHGFDARHGGPRGALPPERLGAEPPPGTLAAPGWAPTPTRTWTGQWTLVLASVPEAQRELRAQLRIAGCWPRGARFYDAAWLRPGGSRADGYARCWSR